MKQGMQFDPSAMASNHPDVMIVREVMIANNNLHGQRRMIFIQARQFPLADFMHIEPCSFNLLSIFANQPMKPDRPSKRSWPGFFRIIKMLIESPG
ncbi:MAG: hypothetical protein OXU96_02535 [Gammaproteobacteria bacterium]|nr:hypothetical protein [Gammaproteobacteria bacterium]